ncbi:hypothetical protein [Mycobacterium sp. IS-836]|uniref:DUF7159 family protein n=1 Tax=Mycobacterium sp. IS-836 TaxID=1834160 RepID=UPI0027147D17|nr:hypothetical protein [Mycobacterium sp. IS-836]
MAPASIQMVLLEGENAEGATVEEDEFDVSAADDAPTISASDRVIAAILGTREGAADAGLELSSIGVAWTDQLEAATLRDALAAHKLENVMLVSAFLAATSLTQFVGGAMGYERTALMLMEPDTATLAVVETADGSIADVYQERLNATPGRLTDDELMHLVAGLDQLPTHPDGLFVLGAGVDIATVRAQLEDATSLSVSAPEEPETALARGAALASANASLFASSTAALAYAQDPGTGAVDANALPEYLSIAAAEPGEDDLAYSAVADDETSAPTVVMDAAVRRRSGLLVGSVLAVAGFSAALALEVALSVGVHSTVGLLPAPLHNLIAPAEQVFAPVPAEVAATPAAAPKPLSPPAVPPPPAAPVPAAPPPAAPVLPAPIAAPPVPIPLVVPPIALPAPPPVILPDPPANPPVLQAPPHPSPPIDSPPPLHVPPPVHVPSPAPPKSPPPHQVPPAQGPNPGGGAAGNPGGPATGPGPSHGTPGDGAPHDVGPAGGGGPVGGPTGGGGASSGGGASAGGGTSSSSGGGSSSSGGGAESGGSGHR